jgi:uncharacterized membrane-anchored protein YhcB (DUF1043 family)
MGVKTINKIIIPVLILILLSVSVFAQVSSDTNAMNQINERLERNKAELIKTMRDINNQSMNATTQSIDENFAVLDTRIQEFFKASKRDTAIVMIVGFLVGFVVSQIIRLTIERSRRRSLIKKGMMLEEKVEGLDKESQELSKKVKELKTLDEKYSKELKSLTKKPPFITIWGVLIAIGAFLLGVAFMLFQVKPSG